MKHTAISLFVSIYALFGNLVLADIPDPRTDVVKLEAAFAENTVIDSLLFARENCYQIFCGSQSADDQFVYLNMVGITNDGRIATLWIGHFFSEPLQYWAPIWSEVVYIEFWTGLPPYTDYAGASAVIHGVPFWDFVDQVLDAALANRKGKFSLVMPGWYGVHLSDSSVLANTAATAEIGLEAIINRGGAAERGEILLNFSINN